MLWRTASPGPPGLWKGSAVPDVLFTNIDITRVLAGVKHLPEAWKCGSVKITRGHHAAGDIHAEVM